MSADTFTRELILSTRASSMAVEVIKTLAFYTYPIRDVLWEAFNNVATSLGLWTREPPPASARLDGQVILVTGGNKGIGREVAMDCATRGAARVIIACRDTLAGMRVAAEINSKFARPSPQEEVGHSDNDVTSNNNTTRLHPSGGRERPVALLFPGYLLPDCFSDAHPFLALPAPAPPVDGRERENG